MPIYEYTCDKCNHEFERIVFGDEEDGITCPACQSRQVKKLMSTSSFRPNGIPTGSGGFSPPACKTSGAGG